MSIPINSSLPSKFTDSLCQASEAIRKMTLKEVQDAENRDYLLLHTDGIQVNLQRNYLNQQIVELLLRLADEKQLSKKINDLFEGHCVNSTENRPALHSALRMPSNESLFVKDTDVVQQVHKTLKQMKLFAKKIHTKQVLGATHKIISDIVHIGIGGSLLGTKLVHDALAGYHNNIIKVHFVSEQDISLVMKQLNPETTLFIIASKSFTTQETIHKGLMALELLKQSLPTSKQEILQKHFIAVTANIAKAREFGLTEDNIFLTWDWVGGRYSVWSAIGFPIMLATRIEDFDEFLVGGYAMDRHFQSTQFAQNIPVLLALLSIWHINFFYCQTQAIIPYNDTLEFLPAFLQQLEMESNGKSINIEGENISYATAPVIWGQTGVSGQHTYYQLLHQGRQFIPIDFVFAKDKHSQTSQQESAITNLLAHASVLTDGNNVIDKNNNEQLPQENTYKALLGNRVSNLILLNNLNPYNMGKLLALYEHKVYVQSVIWNINAFDQWGVETGKKLAHQWQNIFSKQPELLDKVTQEAVSYLK